MRTTVTLDDDVFEMVKRCAEARSISLGKVLSELVRRGVEGWGVFEFEATRPFDESRTYDEEVLDIVDQARTNLNACIVGTVFSYKPELQ